MLKSLCTNRSAPLPLRVFQIDDVVLRDAHADTGARNERRLVAAHCAKSAGLEVVHGLLDKLFEVLGRPATAQRLPYTLVASNNTLYFPGLCADISVDGVLLGSMGVVHPDVLGSFKLPHPVALLDINVELLQ